MVRFVYIDRSADPVGGRVLRGRAGTITLIAGRVDLDEPRQILGHVVTGQRLGLENCL